MFIISLAAICVAQKFGISPEIIKEALETVRVPGRSELVDNKLEIPIMIDYAHSPESLQNILQAVKSYTRGKVISVFGCGGDRDSGKRPIMGEISGKIADYTFITSDNPRTEDPQKIVNQIEEGMKKTKGKYSVIVDRTEAIKQAIEMATKRDIIVLAGKGHEPYQEINGVKYPYDERIIVRDLIRKNEINKRKGLIKLKFETLILMISFITAIILGIIIIPILRKLKVGQIERDDGPQSHLKKQGTPTMGGIIMILAMIIVVTGTYIFLIYNNQGDIANKLLPILLLTIGFGLIGFIDDFKKLVLKNTKD